MAVQHTKDQWYIFLSLCTTAIKGIICPLLANVNCRCCSSPRRFETTFVLHVLCLFQGQQELPREQVCIARTMSSIWESRNLDREDVNGLMHYVMHTEVTRTVRTLLLFLLMHIPKSCVTGPQSYPLHSSNVVYVITEHSLQQCMSVFSMIPLGRSTMVWASATTNRCADAQPHFKSIT